ncbi:hypothetical protein SLEP1_g41212 [Rubroshorea leprosula]|uniref:Uncharacterized protein n=1 Tax=Rubroshorea leprosula TaxID=152421 RepID=A0AAV5L5V3_9ROSI|nr:hypothetical protein SLEP1_g41212 [Rubroshorea leprosula]
MAGGTDRTPLHTGLLQELEGDVSPDWLSRSIFKVPKHLRRISKQSYEPQVVSIGPYHHGKDQLKKMEAYKMFYLKRLLERRPEVSLEDYLKALKVKEKEARECYSEPLNLNGGEKFVEMMLLDGCFIIQLIREKNEAPHTDILLSRATLDLLLVENQLPFFILLLLLDMTGMSNDPFMDMAIKFFSKIIPGFFGGPKNQEDIKHFLEQKKKEDIKHLLGLVHDCWTFSREAKLNLCSSGVVRSSPPEPSEELRFPLLKATDSEKEWRFIRSATGLREAGIIFKKVDFKKDEGRLFDIKFEKGVMSIPTLRIDDHTESILRNLVAYEQCFKGASSKCLTDYITFMDRLINTWKDVQLLSHNGVIDNWLGDHDVVANMFNKLRDSVVISKDHFSYDGTFNSVNEHCDKKWNQWMANLRHNYFHNPWAVISLFAGIFLLLLTVLTSVMSVLSYL